jgi:hypothetical protein
LFKQATNSNIDRGNYYFDSYNWYLLAGMDEGAMYDQHRSDLLIHGGQDGEWKWQTIFTLGDSDQAVYMTMSALIIAASAMVSM